MTRPARDWWPIAFVAIGLAVAAVGLNWPLVSSAVSELTGMVEAYAIILLAPVLGPLAFLVFRLATRRGRKRSTSAIGFQRDASRPDRSGPAAAWPRS